MGVLKVLFNSKGKRPEGQDLTACEAEAEDCVNLRRPDAPQSCLWPASSNSLVL